MKPTASKTKAPDQLAPRAKKKAKAKTKTQTKTPLKASSPVAPTQKRRNPKLTNTEPPQPKAWVLYVLRCADQTLYCGITNRLEFRLAAHNQGKGARYTKGRAPVVVLKKWPAASMSAALKAERAFKRLTKSEKEKKLRSRSRKDAISLLLLGTP